MSSPNCPLTWRALAPCHRTNPWQCLRKSSTQRYAAVRPPCRSSKSIGSARLYSRRRFHRRIREWCRCPPQNCRASLPPRSRPRPLRFWLPIVLPPRSHPLAPSLPAPSPLWRALHPLPRLCPRGDKDRHRPWPTFPVGMSRNFPFPPTPNPPSFHPFRETPSPPAPPWIPQVPPRLASLRKTPNPLSPTSSLRDPKPAHHRARPLALPQRHARLLPSARP